MCSAQPRVQRIGSVKPLATLFSAGVPAAVRLVRRNLTRSSVIGESRGAAGVPPPVKHLLWDGATPADRTLLGAAVVGVFGAEFSDVGPIEAHDGRRRTERAKGAAGASPARGDHPRATNRAAGDAGGQRLDLVYRAQRQRRCLVIGNQWQSQVGFTCKT